MRNTTTNTRFFRDLYTMDALKFVEKYKGKYTVQDHSTPIAHKHGAEIFNKNEYMEIFRPMEQIETANGEKHSQIKVYKGEELKRHLYIDAIMFRKIKPNITLEELVVSLMNEIYIIGKYNHLNSTYVLAVANSIMSLSKKEIDNFDYKGPRKGFCVDKAYCEETGTKANSHSKTVGKNLRMDEIMPLFDEGLTYKQNVEKMKANGITVSEKTLRRYRQSNFLQMKARMEMKEMETLLFRARLEFGLGEMGREDLIKTLPWNQSPQNPLSEDENRKGSVTENKKRKGSVTDDEIKEAYDTTISLKENLSILKESGVKVGKDRLYKYCKDHGIETNSQKGKRCNKETTRNEYR